MIEQTLPLPPFSLSPLTLDAVPPDMPVVQRAWEKCEDLRCEFDTLLHQAPSVRMVIAAWLQDTLAVAPEEVGLLIETARQSYHIDLVRLTAWAQHHADSPMLDTCAHITGNPASLRLLPSQLLKRLAKLDLASLVRQGWTRYWNDRATGTPLSRKEHARAQYRRHLEVAVDIAFASDPSAAALRPVLAVMDNPEWLRIDQRQLCIEAPASAPGSLVFSIEGEPAYTLYSPGRTEVLSYHVSREALEAALPISPGPTAFTSLDSIDQGFDGLFDNLSDQLLATLDHDPGATVIDAATALVPADRLHASWRAPGIFAMPFALETAQRDERGPPSLFEFGRLGNEVPWSTRVELVERQLDGLAKLSEHESKVYRQQQDILLAARTDAQVQIDAILASAKWHSDAHPVTASPALLRAHRQALLAHARIQYLLRELEPAAFDLVEALFKQDDASVLTSSPVLQSSPDTVAGSAQEQVLYEAIVISRRTLLGTPDTSQPFILYWCGETGGMLPCDDLAALAGYLGQHDATLSLRFEPLYGDGLAHALNTQLARAHGARQALKDERGIEAAASSLPQASQSLGQQLQIPWHEAREVASALVRRQEQLAVTLGSTATAFARMAEDTRAAFTVLANDYLAALHDSQELIERDLPERTQFCQRLVSQALRRDFDDFDGGLIQLQLPVSVSWRNHPIAGGGTPGTPTKPVLTASEETEDIDLVTLMLHNIDSAMLERLSFVKPKGADGKPLAPSVAQGLDRDYLQGLAHSLDLGKHYESTLHGAFDNAAESEHAQAYRRECLLAPYRLMLALQSLLLHQSGHLSSAGQKILSVAIDADSQAAYQVDSHDIRLLPAHFTAGGEDTEEHATTLSGVTFIEDRISRVTLLYRPDHPTLVLRQYDNLEQARQALFDDTDEYLVSRALSGTPNAHRARLREARTRRFDGMIGVGTPWPSTTSLAAHLLAAHRGRLVMRHRATARANLDLYFEHFATQSAGVLIGFKIALGAIPFLGLPVSVYDAFVSATEVVQALSTGSTADILQAFNDLLVSLIDIATDTLGGGVGVNGAAIRRSTRSPRLQSLRQGTSGPSLSKPVHRGTQRFSGLEHDQPLSLEGLRPANHGKYRGIYRHAQGNFILVADHPYKVSWDAAARTWQLDGNARHTWKRAIAQDEQGDWHTHFALYGVHRRGAGVGGGQALGHIADTLDPLWPAAIHERLPRWWRDHAYRQHNRLRDSITRDMRQLQPRTDQLNQQMKRALEQHGQLDVSLTTTLNTMLADAQRIHGDCQAFQQVSAGRMRKRAQDQANDLAILICNGRQRLTSDARFQLNHALDEIDQLRHLLHQNSLELVPELDDMRRQLILQQVSEHKKEMRRARVEALAAVDDIREQVSQLKSWRRQVKQVGDQRDLFNTIDHTLNTFGEPMLNYMAVAQLTALVLKPGQALSSGGIRLQFLMKDPRTELDRALYALHQLGETRASAAQRNSIVTASLQCSERFRRHLNYWQSSYEPFIDTASAQRLGSSLLAYEEHFRSLLLNKTKPSLQPPKKGTVQPRVFETTDNRLLVGEPDLHSANVYRITGVNGRTEIYHQDRSGKFTLTNPDTAPVRARNVSLAELQSEARRQLDELQAYRRKVQRYADQGMNGASLEDLMLFKATDLDYLASRIAEQASDDSLVYRLRDAAREVTGQGRALRVDYILGTRQPNGAQLEFLLEEKLVRIEKVGGLVELRRTVDGRRDFLQEFVVLDTRLTQPRPLWYAHFHFDKEGALFDEFIKGHLKTAAQRHLGREWQDSHVEQIWRGELARPLARKHFTASY